MKVVYLSKRILFSLMIPIIAIISVWGSYISSLHGDSLSGKIVFIDPGHGGIDPGANVPGYLEKDINLLVALQLRDLLSEQGATPILSRETDTELSPLCENERVKGRYRRDLAARVELVKKNNSNAYISVHTNANPDSRRHGAEAFYNSKSEPGKSLANLIQNELTKVTPSASRAAPGNYFVLKRNNEIPSVLVEVGYLTNPDDRARLENPEHHRKIATAIVEGLKKYYATPAWQQ